MAQGIAQVLGEDGQSVPDPFAGQLPAVSASYAPFSFTASRFVLEALARRAVPVIPSRDFQPVLRNFLAVAGPGWLRLSATDLELAVVATTRAVQLTASDESKAPFKVVLPARRLLTVLTEAPEGDVTIAVSGQTARVTAGTAVWELRLSSDGADYPAIPDPDSCELSKIPLQPFLRALRTVRYAVSKTKPSLMQVEIRESSVRPGSALVTGCDIARFSQARIDGLTLALRIPAAGTPAAVDELIKMLDASPEETISVGTSGTSLVFVVGSVVFMASQLPHEFPDVEGQLLRSALENTGRLVTDRAELAAAIRRTRITADPETSAIGLRLAKGSVTAFSRDKNGNTAEETIPAEWDGGDRTLVVHHQFLTDMINVHPSPSCTFRLGNDVGRRRSPLLLSDEDAGVTGIVQQMAGASLVGY